MPFDEKFDDIYELGIKESCEEVDVYCERVDEQIYDGTILERIYNQISKADLIIADMSGRNPNVFYEVGYAHALNKPTVLLTQDSKDIPFDLKHYPHIVYENKITKIRNELTKRIKWFQQNYQNENLPFKIEIEIFVNNKNLTNEEVICEYPHDQIPNFEFTIFNASPYTYQPGEYQIAIISENLSHSNTIDVKTTKMPDGKYLHMLPVFYQMFPGIYLTTSTGLYMDDPESNISEFPIVIRVFTDSGYRDYNLYLKKGKL